jgi:hypothetical protein
MVDAPARPSSRALISEAGFGERFIHRTGRTTHEPPYMIEG